MASRHSRTADLGANVVLVKANRQSSCPPYRFIHVRPRGPRKRLCSSRHSLSFDRSSLWKRSQRGTGHTICAEDFPSRAQASHSNLQSPTAPHASRQGLMQHICASLFVSCVHHLCLSATRARTEALYDRGADHGK